MPKPKLKCDKCGKKFSDPRALGVHRRFSHGIIGAHHTRNAKAKLGRPRGSKNSHVAMVEGVVKYCPNCGFDVRSLTVAYSFIRERREKLAALRAEKKASKQ
jgi:hypothetical protein